jgi:hypothetical protein
VKNGVPFDVALSLDDIDRTAYCIIFGGFEGHKWNWSRMEWEKHE